MGQGGGHLSFPIPATNPIRSRSFANEPQQLVAHSEDVTGRANIQASDDRSRGSIPLEVFKGHDAVGKIGFRTMLSLSRTTAEIVLFAENGVSFREQRRGECRLVGHSEFPSRKQESRQTRMDRHPRHLLTRLRQATAFSSAELLKQGLCLSQGLGARSFKPRKCCDIQLTPGPQLQNRTGKIDATNFRFVVFGEAPVIAFAPQSHAQAGLLSSRSTGSLLGGGSRDFPELQPVQSYGWFESFTPSQSRVDHGGDPVDGDGCFRNVRGEHNLAAVAALQNSILLVTGQISVKGHDRQLSLFGNCSEFVGRPANFSDPW